MERKILLRVIDVSVLLGLTLTLLSIFYTSDIAFNYKDLEDMRFGFPVGFVMNDKHELGDSTYDFPEIRTVSLDILDDEVNFLWLPFIISLFINSVLVFLILFLIYEYIPATRKAYRFVNFWYALLAVIMIGILLSLLKIDIL